MSGWQLEVIEISRKRMDGGNVKQKAKAYKEKVETGTNGLIKENKKHPLFLSLCSNNFSFIKTATSTAMFKRLV